MADAAACVVAPGAAPGADNTQAEVGANGESEEQEENMGFDLCLITKKQPTQPALFMEQRSKGLLLFKKSP